jgi:uncharacterized membrane protein
MDMKAAIAIVTSVLFMGVLGCESPRGGGMSGGEGFKIGIPTFTVKIIQGETQNVNITLNRGEYFKRDVTLDIKASPGISVVPVHAVVKGSEKPEVSLRITAPKNADLGEYTIYVTGTPETGEATSAEFKVKVVLP